MTWTEKRSTNSDKQSVAEPENKSDSEPDRTNVRHRHIIRTSDRSTFKRCRQQWDLSSKIRQNFEPDIEAPALSFGTAIHAGLETWYNPDTWPRTRDKGTQNVMRSLAFAKFVESLGDDYESQELGKAMLEGYFNLSIKRDDFTPVFVEIEFEVPIPVNVLWLQDNITSYNRWFSERYNHETGNHELWAAVAPGTEYLPVVYQGRIDMIVQDKHGRYWIWDHKTASSFGSTDHLEMDSQCGSYMWAIQQQLGIRIEGVVYNELAKKLPHSPKVLKKGGLSVAKDQDTTYELYMQAIYDNNLSTADYADMLDLLKEQGSSKYFRRTQVHRSQDELEVLGRTIALEAIDMLNSPSIYPNPSKMTCNFCAYRNPCLNIMEGSDPSFSLQQQYHKRVSSLDVEVATE